MDTIYSTSNKTIKLVKQLQFEKKYRDATNMFCVETKRIVDHLIKDGYVCKFILVSENSKYQYEFKKYQTYLTSDTIINSLSSLSNGDGIIGVFEKKKTQFTIKQKGKYVILDRIQNPANLGAIIRTCLAFNIDGVIVTNDSVDIYNPSVIRGSMGSIFSIPFKFYTSLPDAINSFKVSNYTIYGTALEKTAKSINEVKFSDNSVVIFGNEGNGLNKKDLELCEQIIYIPINDKIDSLNIGASVAIVAWKLSQ
ncbi:MAG: RNA methyltransferase [Mycoplasmoidaceae bacterium]|nr:MAG: RNA methyltransferase [Mycoplasmoidaceae bacterium]